MTVTLKVWRQAGADAAGRFETYDVPDVSPDMSFLEMLDVVNERLIARRRGADRVRPRLPRGHLRLVRDDDQRPGRTVPSAAPPRASCTCASSRTATTITVEPWRARGVPARQGPRRRPLRVRPHHRGRRLHHRAAPAARPTATSIPVPKPVADAAMDAAACIGCGACVAACPNGAAQLFTVGEGAAPQPAAAGPGRALGRASIDMVEHDGELLRLVHQPRRVRGRVPEGDLDRLHRADEPRLRQGAVQAAPPGLHQRG